jgi:deoxyribodipyrimidine photo-lyase
MTKIDIIWFRNNLRTEDNEALIRAVENGNKLLAVYCLDPKFFNQTIYGFRKTERFRAKFLLETLNDLKSQLEKLNISLITPHTDIASCFKEIGQSYSVQNIFTQKEWTQEENDDKSSITEVLPNARWHEYYDQFLFHPEDVPFDKEDIPMVFTQFRKSCEKQARVRKPFPIPQALPEDRTLKVDQKTPSLESLGFDSFSIHPSSAFPFKGGELQANDRMDYYIWDSDKIAFYKKTRNGLLGKDYSAKFSPWLANGSLSARVVYQEIKAYEKEVQKNESTYWLIFELIWRDYFKYVSLKFGNAIFKQAGILNRTYTWHNKMKFVREWTDGRTREPFVNANMIELKETGWMSNRGRQNVASYFSKNLKLDWRIGAAYFESMLLDYDVHSNYGNWMYVSGVGNDPRDRVFNVQLQASRYDKNSKFQKLWLSPTLF